MTDEDFADLVSPKIRNAPIVRELDKVRQREFRGWVILAAPPIAVLVFSVWQHFELLQHGYRLEQMRLEYATERVLNRHLQLEVETLRSPARIEQVATEQLRMVVPDPEQELIVEPPREEAAPEPAIVATRQEASDEPIRRLY